MQNYNSIRKKFINSWLFKDKLFWITFPSVFIFDQITKYLVYSNMYLGESIPESAFIRITYARNTGTAFSLFRSYGDILLYLSIFVAVFFTIYFIFIEKPKIFMRLFISLVVAGALGNILDRIRFGYKRDGNQMKQVFYKKTKKFKWDSSIEKTSNSFSIVYDCKKLN